MRLSGAIFVVLIALSFAGAQPNPRPAGQSSNSGPESELKTVAREMHDALMRGDDDRGQVTHMIINSGGNGTKMKKID